MPEYQALLTLMATSMIATIALRRIAWEMLKEQPEDFS